MSEHPENNRPAISEATQDYLPGDVILHLAQPLVQVTKYEYRLSTCDCCMRSQPDSLIACPACRKVYYCSRECQDRSWSGIHRLECPILARHKPLQFESNGLDYMQRLTLRLYLLMAEKDNEEEEGSSTSGHTGIRRHKFSLHNGLTRMLDDMECHTNELKDSPQFGGIVNYFKLYKLDAACDYDLLLRCYGILHVNSFGIDCYDVATTTSSSSDMQDLNSDVQIRHCGTGLYVEASVFDHSCVPNAAASGDGLTLEIRALSPIRRCEQIYIDYLQDVMPKEERRRILAERYFFHCQCARGCADDLVVGALDTERQDASVAARAPFDGLVDFKRYAVLNRLIDSLLQQNEQLRQSIKDKDSSSSNNSQTTTGQANNEGRNEKPSTSLTRRNETNRYGQLYQCWKQRLHQQELYYTTAGYHPCLSLFYREYVRFLLLLLSIDNSNQQQLNNCTEEIASINQRQQEEQQKNIPSNNAATTPTTTSTTSQQIEQDLLEFGGKAAQHLTITHGINHSFYSRLFPPKDGYNN